MKSILPQRCSGAAVRDKNRLWDLVNEAFAPHGRDWAVPNGGAQFSREGIAGGINARPAGICDVDRDVKAHGRAGRSMFRRRYM